MIQKSPNVALVLQGRATPVALRTYAQARRPAPAQPFGAQTRFCHGIATRTQLTAHLAQDGAEIAFCGRSNVGKSSLINALCQQKQLAHTSQRPGRTMQLNVFALGAPQWRLLDLPGYGYAAQSQKAHKTMLDLCITYLEQSRALRAVFVLLDARRDKPSEQDTAMLDLLAQAGQSHHLILTKADATKPEQIQQRIDALSPRAVTHICSAKTGQGLAALRHQLVQLLHMP